MTQALLNETKIITKLKEIEADLNDLEKLKEFSQKEFSNNRITLSAAENFLRRALEAVFDIGNHILSRYSMRPSEQPKSYVDIAIILGKKKIVSEKFAQEKLTKMAKFRNKLIHMYDVIESEQIHQIIQDDLDDFEIFARCIKKILENPKKYGLNM